jgi:hypothetical protein
MFDDKKRISHESQKKKKTFSQEYPNTGAIQLCDGDRKKIALGHFVTRQNRQKRCFRENCD